MANTSTQAVQLTINLNSFNFTFDPKEIVAASSPYRNQPIKQLNNSTQINDSIIQKNQIYAPNKPVSTYESRITTQSLGDSKIYEVIGWMLILAAIIIALLFCVNLSQDIEFLGFAAPLAIITTFFMTYINWLSLKFFVNS